MSPCKSNKVIVHVNHLACCPLLHAGFLQVEAVTQDNMGLCVPQPTAWHSEQPRSSTGDPSKVSNCTRPSNDLPDGNFSDFRPTPNNGN